MMVVGRMVSGGNGPYGPALMAPGMGHDADFRNPATVPAGPVSLRARNTGMMIHEVMVLPLGTGRAPGQLTIGANGQVDESASLLRPPAVAAPMTVTHPARNHGLDRRHLAPGRYELLCNIAGHYGAGMYTELDVVSNR